jgi:hypothetical protein
VNSERITTFSIHVIIMLGLCGPVYAASGADLVVEGNRAYHGKDYEEALAAYDKASVEAPEAPSLYFNKGAVYYMQGDYTRAREMFEQAALKAKDLELEAAGQYNLGNCAFRESERQRDGDLQKSLAALEQSVRNYQRALELNASLMDAAHNIEVARLTMKQILDEIKKQEEQAKQQQAEQEKQLQRLKELIQRQEQLVQETKALEEKERGESEGRKEDSKGLAEEQAELRNDTQGLADQMEPSPNTPNASEAKKHIEQAVSDQDKARDDLDVTKLPEAHSAQEEAAEELKKALAALGGKGRNPEQKKTKGEQGEQQEGQPPPKSDQNAGPEQPAVAQNERAHDILDQERENREQRQVPGARGSWGIDRDW